MNRLWFSCHQYQPQDFWGSSQCWQLAQSLWGTWCGSVWAGASCTGSTQRTPETSSAECRKPVHPSWSAACTGKAQSVEFRHTIKQGWEASRSCSLISNQIHTVISHWTPSTLWDAPQFAFQLPWQEWLQQAETAFSGTKLPSQWEWILIHKPHTAVFKIFKKCFSGHHLPLQVGWTTQSLNAVFRQVWLHGSWSGLGIVCCPCGNWHYSVILTEGCRGHIKILLQWFVWLFPLFNLAPSGRSAASAAAQFLLFQEVMGSSPQGFTGSTSKNQSYREIWLGDEFGG